ncbi:MAG: non-canonical purine NTP diphosphatase [Chitinophagales bacterium]
MRLIFATNNAHKVSEVKKVIGDKFEVISLKEFGFTDDIPEPHDTLEENAYEKSSVIHQKFDVNCFSEDTGLEVMALNGEPGVKSARYAGEKCLASDNIKLLLRKLEGIENRQAQFRTVVSLILEGKEYQFEGIAKGKITHSQTGEKGFGYDPIFVPENFDRTFAEMNAAEKNEISHRGKAIEKLVKFLKNY